jgi:hypothetical protein
MAQLSEYPVSDVGSQGGYDPSVRLFFPSLDFDLPSYSKVLERVEVVYDSLREIPLTLCIWRRYPLTDTGIKYHEITVTTAAAQAEEPGVWFGNASPVWGTARYAPARRFTARAEFVPMHGRAFDFGLIAACDVTPWMLVKLAFHWSPMAVEGRGELVSA